MGSFDLKAHIFQGAYHIPAGIFSQIHGSQVKITRFIMGVNYRNPLFIEVE